MSQLLFCSSINKENLVKAEHPGAQPEVLSRALLAVAWTWLPTKGDRAFAVNAPKVGKWAVSGDKASQNTFFFKSYSLLVFYKGKKYIRGNAGIMGFLLH